VFHFVKNSTETVHDVTCSVLTIHLKYVTCTS